MTPPIDYILTFLDDFPGNTVNPQAWVPTDTATIAKGYGLEYWDPARASVANGLLKLQATDDLHSGELRGLRFFKLPLYIAFRAKLPQNAPGLWPGGWLLDKDNTYQEVDVFECDSSQPHRVGQNLHWAGGGVDNGGYSDSAIDYTAGFHTYAALVTLSKVDFFIDDSLTRTWAQLPSPTIWKDMQIRLSLSLFGAAQPYHTPYTPGLTPMPADFLIESVQVYQPVLVDSTSPTVSILSPLQGAQLPRKSTIPVEIWVSDNIGISRVELYINNVLVDTRRTAPYTLGFSTSGKPRATYAIRVVAYDAAGNSSLAIVTATSG